MVAAASEKGALVVNGMSYRARDLENANSAVLVGLEPKDFGSSHPLAGVELQREIERAAFSAGGGGYCAPVTTAGAFLGTGGTKMGTVKPSYLPAVRYAEPERYLPDFITDAIRGALKVFGGKIAGFDTPDAILTGVESRSSSPVRILRGNDCVSPSLRGLYPCGEGAGYAGGIVSAAVDGIRCAEAVIGAKR